MVFAYGENSNACLQLKTHLYEKQKRPYVTQRDHKGTTSFKEELESDQEEMEKTLYELCNIAMSHVKMLMTNANLPASLHPTSIPYHQMVEVIAKNYPRQLSLLSLEDSND